MTNRSFLLTLAIIFAAAAHVGAQDAATDTKAVVRRAAVATFQAFAKEPVARKYPPEDWEYVGEEGRFTPEQVRAIKSFEHLMISKRAATSLEKIEVANAFGSENFETFRKNFVRNAFNDPENDSMTLFDANAGSATLADVLGSPSLSAEQGATEAEIAAAIDEALKSKSLADLAQAALELPAEERLLVSTLLYDRRKDADDRTFANLLALRVAGLKGFVHKYDELEQTVLQAVEERPDSIRTRCLAAETFYFYLPRKVVQKDGATSRVEYYPEQGEADPAPPVQDPMNELGMIGSLEGAKRLIGKRNLNSTERDRVAALRILLPALEKVEGIIRRDASETVMPIDPENKELCREYLRLLRNAVQFYPPDGEPFEKQVLLDVKTDLETLPEFGTSPRIQSIDPAKSNGVAGNAQNSPEKKTYKTPASFDAAANDGERAAYLDELNALFVEIEGQTSGAGVLAALGSFAQRKFGARVTLDAYRELITAPKSAAVRQPYVGPGMNGGGNPDLLPRWTRARDELEPQIAQFAELAENETFLLPTEEQMNAGDWRLRRVVLSDVDNYFEFWRKSLKLQENYKALSEAAHEYEFRGQYEKAIECWERARKLAQSELEAAEAESKDAAVPRKELFECDRQLTALRQTGFLSLIGKGSYAAGTNVALTLATRGVKSVDLEIFRVNLAPILAQTRTEEFWRQREIVPFIDFASNYLSKLTEGQFQKLATSVKTLKEEIESSEPGKTVEKKIELDIQEPGLYAVYATTDAGMKRSAIFLATRYAIRSFANTVYVFDWKTGAPVPDKELEIFAPYRAMLQPEPVEAKSYVVKTDQNGAVTISEEKYQDGFDRAIVVVQPEDPTLADIQADVADCLNIKGPYFQETVQAYESYAVAKEAACLQIEPERPLYRPGETARMVGRYFQPVSNYSDARGLRENPQPTPYVCQLVGPIENPAGAPGIRQFYEDLVTRAPIASVETEADQTGSFQAEFALPEDAKPGVYAVSVSPLKGELQENKVLFLTSSAAAPLIVADPAAEAPTENAPIKAAALNTSETDALRLEVPEIVFKRGEKASIKIHTNLPAEAANAYILYGPGRPTQPDYQRVPLENGVGEFDLNFSRAVNVSREQYVISVEIIHGGARYVNDYYICADSFAFKRGASLDVSKAKAAPGEDLRATVRFQDAAGNPFDGSVSLAVFDKSLAGGPKYDLSGQTDRFTPFRTLRVGDPSDFFAPVSDAKLPGAAYQDDFVPALAANFLDAYISRENLARRTVAPLPPNRFFAWYGLNSNSQRSPLADIVAPPYPKNASPDSELILKAQKEPANIVEFDFKAPKTPGVYKVVMRAVDGWMRVSYAEAELAVE